MSNQSKINKENPQQFERSKLMPTYTITQVAAAFALSTRFAYAAGEPPTRDRGDTQQTILLPQQAGRG